MSPMAKLHLSCGHTTERPVDAPIVKRPEDGFFHCGREVRIIEVEMPIPGPTLEGEAS